MSDLWLPRMARVLPRGRRDTIREPQKLGNTCPLDEDAGNQVSVLRTTERRGPGGIPDFKDSLPHLIPGVSDLEVAAAGGYLVVRLQHATSQGGTWIDKASVYPFAPVSTKLLRTIGSGYGHSSVRRHSRTEADIRKKRIRALGQLSGLFDDLGVKTLGNSQGDPFQIVVTVADNCTKPDRCGIWRKSGAAASCGLA